MIALKSLFIFDLSAMLLMIIIAYLSRRLGDALKIPPWYRVHYITTACILAAIIMDAIGNGSADPDQRLITISMTLRAMAALAALLVCFPYWKWLFTEYFHLKR